jgi:hypothetical protein
MIKPTELPPYAGLFEYENGSLTVAVKAPYRDAMLPRWTFVASLLARCDLQRASSPDRKMASRGHI